MNESNQPDSELNLEAPERLVAALKESSERKILIPTYVDRTVLDAARRHLNRHAKTNTGHFRRWMLWPALAMGLAVVMGITRLVTTPAPAKFAREDLNRDGNVNILDSFALARELKKGQSLPARFDVNGDGVVDERDVALIAAHAVAIGKGNRS